jgi:CRP/FNR family transcriptional regulator, cyclic AMP receptor protein
MTPDGSKELFAQVGWLSRQPASFRNELLAHARVVEFERGEPVYREGDPGGSIYGVIAGGVALLIGPPRLSARMGHVLSAGAWFGVGPVFSGGSRTLEFRATERSLLVAVPRLVIEDLRQRDPETLRRLGDLANIGVDLGARMAAELLIPSAMQRVAAVLLRVAAPDPKEGRAPSEGVMISQTQLAEMSNTSRNIVNTALRRFRNSGWVATSYARISVLDVTGLAAYAYDEP